MGKKGRCVVGSTPAIDHIPRHLEIHRSLSHIKIIANEHTTQYLLIQRINLDDMILIVNKKEKLL